MGSCRTSCVGVASMADEVVLNKLAVMERCLKRINEEYVDNEAELESSYTRQDAIILNLLRASEAAIDLAMHATRVGELGCRGRAGRLLPFWSAPVGSSLDSQTGCRPW